MSEGRGLTRPAIGVGSLLIFFTRPGLMELSNLTETTDTRRHRKRNLIQGNAFKLQMIISYVASQCLNPAQAKWNNLRKGDRRVWNCVRGTKTRQRHFWGSCSGVGKLYDKTDPKSELRISASPSTRWELLTRCSALHPTVSCTCEDVCPSAVISAHTHHSSRRSLYIPATWDSLLLMNKPFQSSRLSLSFSLSLSPVSSLVGFHQRKHLNDSVL